MRIGPRSLKGQVLLALALALLLAQAISTALLFRLGIEHRRDMLLHTAALRLIAAAQQRPGPPDAATPASGGREIHAETVEHLSLGRDDQRWPAAEPRLRAILAEEDMPVAAVAVVERPVRADALARERLVRRAALFPHHRRPLPDHLLLAGLQRQSGGSWLVVRVLEPPAGAGPHLLASLIAQTLVIYLVLVGAMALILRRITRPLAALTRRAEHFGGARDPEGPLIPQGPDDLRRLMQAHNAMEARIVALLDEKDVMLGAIGHDLKTPLAALRVRIESVEDDIERQRMAATIEDITRTLDDILSLARVGRPSDPLEATELSALVASVVEEYEDMGLDVMLADSARLVARLRTTWVRRALRNLIGNALRYGQRARVSLLREADKNGRDWAVIRIDDEGPGIPEAEIAAMLEPFARGDRSRSSTGGGAGLGLTLARAIAEQHGGAMIIANRAASAERPAGLTARLRLPI